MQRRLVEDLGLAELAREGDMLLVGDGLVGEDQHEVPRPGIAHRPDRRRVHRLPHIDATDFRAERGMTGRHGEGHVGSRDWVAY